MKYVTPLIVAALLGACGEVPLLEELSPERTCRRTIHVGPLGVPLDVADVDSLEAAAPADSGADQDDGEDEGQDQRDVVWKVPRGSTDRSQLNAWCAAVGPAVVGGWADPPTAPVTSLAVVAWNLRVGGGDLRRLVQDLREGVFTDGDAVDHFVLLLQEAYREDDTVPAFDAGLPLGGGEFGGPPGATRRDIVTEAEELGLALLYAPSMRNGEGRGDDAPEDRGNAILSTLPLSAPLAVELPVARQRRVAVAARVRLGPEEGHDLLMASVHLENDASGWTRDELARLQQTEALLEGLPEEGAAVAGGDFNTWTRGPEEALMEPMLRAFPDTPPFPPGHTYVRAYGILRRQLDYLFFRFPEDGSAEVIRVPDPYASDHLPVVGRIRLPAPPADGAG